MYSSPLPSLQPIHHYGYFLDFPTRKHAIALTLILASFKSNRSSCLWPSKGLQVVHNRGHDYSNSSFTLQGCTTTHMPHQLLPGDGPFKWVPTRMLSRHFTHCTISSPRESPIWVGTTIGIRPIFSMRTQTLCDRHQAQIDHDHLIQHAHNLRQPLTLVPPAWDC